MADYIPPGEVNLYRCMPELRKEVYTQRSGCCWAITVSTGVSYTYYKAQRDPDFELSPQDLLDRVWYYSSLQQRASFEHDTWGAYACNHSKAYRYINTKRVGLLRNYPFVDRLSENIGPIANTEVPRVCCTPYESLTLEQAIRAAQNVVPKTAGVVVTQQFINYKRVPRVCCTPYESLTLEQAIRAAQNVVSITAGVDVTQQFINYKRGDPIYEKAPNARVHGAHSVLIIGVNVKEGYFRIRNSWGPTWGDGGYGLIRFNSLARFSCASSAWMEPYIRAV